MKQNRYLALTLVGLLSVGLLSGCGSKANDSDELTESPSPTPVQESPAVETDSGSSDEAYTAAMVLSVDGTQLTLQLYTPADESTAQGIADPAEFDLANYTLSQDTMLVAVDDESVLHSTDDSALMLADLKPAPSCWSSRMPTTAPSPTWWSRTPATCPPTSWLRSPPILRAAWKWPGTSPMTRRAWSPATPT